MTDTILVVDDEPDLEDLVKAEIPPSDPRRRLRFLFARDGVDALDQLSARRNRHGGHRHQYAAHGRADPARTLSEGEKRLSTIIVSAYGDMANIRTAMNRGAFDFLTKPIDFSDFETTIRKTLAHIGASARSARPPSGGRARARPLALFLAQLGAARWRCDATALAGATARDRDSVHRYRRLHGAGGKLEPDAVDAARRIFDRHDRVVFAHDGTVAKIIGDAIHVLFGAPGDQPERRARDRLRAGAG